MSLQEQRYSSTQLRSASALCKPYARTYKAYDKAFKHIRLHLVLFSMACQRPPVVVAVNWPAKGQQ